MANNDPVDLEAQEASKREAQERIKRRDGEDRDDMRWLLSSKRGRRIVFRLLERAGVFRSSFNTNAMTMAFNEGRRDEGLVLTQRLMVSSPEMWTQMMKENVDD